MDTEASSPGPIFFFSATSPFSNFYPRAFIINGVTFHHMEGFIMFCKAMLFGDRFTAEKILTCYRPLDAKKLGREVRGFDKAIWDAKIEGFAFQGNVGKFGQHPDLHSHLMRTGERELVEASPYDRIWGIGFAADDSRLANRELWGENKQGRILMRTRQYFRTGS